MLFRSVLVPLTQNELGLLLPAAARGEGPMQHRTMVEAKLDDGQTLLGLNEVFIGHRSHQSARYEIRRQVGGGQEHGSGFRAGISARPDLKALN